MNHRVTHMIIKYTIFVNKEITNVKKIIIEIYIYIIKIHRT